MKSKTRKHSGGGPWRGLMTKSRGMKGVSTKKASIFNPFKVNRKFKLPSGSKVKVKSGQMKFRFRDTLTGNKKSIKVKLNKDFYNHHPDLKGLKGDQLRQKLENMESELRKGNKIKGLTRVSEKTFGKSRGLGNYGKRPVLEKITFDKKGNLKSKREYKDGKYFTETRKYDKNDNIKSVKSSIRNRGDVFSRSQTDRYKYITNSDGKLITKKTVSKGSILPRPFRNKTKLSYSDNGKLMSVQKGRTGLSQQGLKEKQELMAKSNNEILDLLKQKGMNETSATKRLARLKKESELVNKGIKGEKTIQRIQKLRNSNIKLKNAKKNLEKSEQQMAATQERIAEIDAKLKSGV